MGKEWDDDKGGRDKWIAWLSSIMKECLRVLKPGGHAAVWALPRTSHWTGMALETAGFEVRDCISYLYDSGRDVQAFLETLSPEQRTMLEIILANSDDSFNVMLHCFGSGFPKSLDISKAIDSHLGHEREVVGRNVNYRPISGKVGYHGESTFRQTDNMSNITAPASPEAKQHDGWGTALKPAAEYWWLVRKPLSEPTVAQNVLRWGVGGINVDASRVGERETLQFTGVKNGSVNAYGDYFYEKSSEPLPSGRFPSHLIHDGSDPVEAEFAKAGVRSSAKGMVSATKSGNSEWRHSKGMNTPGRSHEWEGYADTGTPSRFFYCAKPSSRERNEGLEGFEEIFAPTMGNGIGVKPHDPETATPKRNIHPTVKSLQLMSYLCTMLTPKGGTVLDCFMGSGSTGVAAMKSGFNFIGIEQHRPYFEIAEARIRHANLGQQGEIIAPEPLPVTRKPKLQMELF